MSIQSFEPNSDRVIHLIKVDLANKNVDLGRVIVTQYDDRIPLLAVRVFSNGEKYSLSNITACKIRWKKPDNTVVIADTVGISEDGYTAYFEVTQNMSAVDGDVKACVQLYIPNQNEEGNGVVNSSLIYVTVKRNPILDGDIPSESQIPWARVAETGDYDDLNNKPEIPDNPVAQNDVPRYQAMLSVPVVNAITNKSGRRMEHYTATLVNSPQYTYYYILKDGEEITEEDDVKEYMRYMCGSEHVPVWNNDFPVMTTFLMDNGTMWKAQYLGNTYAGNHNLVLYMINNALISALNIATPAEFIPLVTTISWKTILIKTVTSNTTFTFENANEGTIPEYRAILTNSGDVTVTITLPSGITINTNDDNIIVSGNTFTLPSGVSVELNCMNSKCIVYNFDAQ